MRRQSTTRMRNGSILYRPTTDLPPEIEELRHRDIEPDSNSALDKALAMAKAMAENSTTAAAPAGMAGRRASVKVTEPPARERSKVEGREIQQVK
jgi:hypothetical protein